jgi:sirohydrochlorin cobaltochelatase
MSAADMSKDEKAAVVLVAHGSPDPDWRRPLEQLHARLAEALGGRAALAYLAHPPTIADAIAELAAVGERHVVVVAALLSPGGRHVKRDIPAAVAEARARFPELRLELSPGALGEDPRVIAALAEATLARLTR